MTIRNKIIMIIGITLIISVTLSGGIYYFITMKSIKERTIFRLESIAIQKENQLNDYINERIEDIEGIVNEKFFIEAIEKEVNNINSNTEATRKNHREIVNLLRERIRNNTNFVELFVLDLKGKITISSWKEREGKLKAYESFFIEGKDSTQFQNFFFDVDINQPTLTISSPIKDSEGRLIGVLSGRLNINKIAYIMSERVGLGETGEIYIVNKYNLLVSISKYIDSLEFKKIMHSEAIVKCKQHNSFSGFFNDYRDVEVLGICRWLPKRELFLLAKIDKSDAFKPLNNLKSLIIFNGLISALIAIVAGFFLTRAMSRRIKLLRNATQQISKGNLNVTIEASKKDEIDQLAESFIQMVKDLKETTVSRDMLVKEVEERKKTEKQLAENASRITYQHNILKKQNNEIVEKTLQIQEQAENLNQTNKRLEERQQLIENQSKELGVSNKNLTKLNATKDKLFSIIAHDLRSPFSTLLGFSKLILDRYETMDDAKKRRFMELIHESGNNIYKLLEKLLQWSRTQTGDITCVPEKMLLHKVISDNLLIVKNMLVQKQISVENTISEEQCITADVDMINTVFRNIIGNSIKFTENGKLSFESKPVENNYLEIKISDTGTGIPSDVLRNIFMLDDSKIRVGTTGEKGSGLGLIICKEFIARNKGAIKLQSEHGIGTTVTIKLPVCS